jgi:hypothetical protein
MTKHIYECSLGTANCPNFFGFRTQIIAVVSCNKWSICQFFLQINTWSLEVYNFSAHLSKYVFIL